MRHTLILAIAVALVAAAAPAALAKKKDKKAEEVWVHPEYSSQGVGRIALLPVVSYDNNFKTENLIETRIAQAFAGAGYRWISASAVRSLVLSSGGDSAVKALRQTLLVNPRVDSLRAAALCASFHCDAVLGVRVDLWEQMELPVDQSGKPSSTATLSAAMVGSSGKLLWSALGSQTQDGPYQTAAPAATDGKDFLRAQRRSDGGSPTGQSGAPSFEEVLTLLFKRWAMKFPVMTAATDAPPPPASAPTDSSLKTAPTSEPK